MEHTAGLIQGIRGTPAPMVEFLLNAPTALIQGVASQVHDMEGIRHTTVALGSCPVTALLKPVNLSISTISIH